MNTDPADGYEHGADANLRATESALVRAEDARSIVLVEGISDQIAVETLAKRLGRVLGEEGVVVVPIGGAQAIKHFVPRFAGRAGIKLSGLVDSAEADYFARALGEPDLADPLALERHGFFVCYDDLEDELIRSVDERDIRRVLASEGDLGAFGTLQKQSVWRDQPFDAQMHRWMRSASNRTGRYARLLVLAAKPDRLPRSLVALVERI